MTYLRGETLEQRRRTLVLHELLHDRHAADLVFKVGVLDTRLDSVERRSNRDRRDGTRDRRDKVLPPRRLVEVRHAEQVVLRDRRRTEQLQTGGRMSEARSRRRMA